MKSALSAVIVLLLVATSVQSAVYKEGKSVMGVREAKVDIARMKWGVNEFDEDRLLGQARLYEPRTLEPSDIVLVFDTFNAKGEKIDTIEITFNYREYGYRYKRNYYEGEFCVDFDRNPEAKRMMLTNVKYKGMSAIYKTTFNISGSLNRTLFKLRKPKSVPTRR